MGIPTRIELVFLTGGENKVKKLKPEIFYSPFILAPSKGTKQERLIKVGEQRGGCCCPRGRPV